MATKIYKMIWALYLGSAAILFLTGNFTMMTGVVFGFVGFGVIYFGMMSVLPSMVGHNAPREETVPAPVVREVVRPVAQPVKEAYAGAKSAVVH